MIHQNIIYDIDKMFAGGIVTDITPAYRYRDGQRTDETDGIRCRVVLPACNFDSIFVRIKNITQLEMPSSKPIPAKFRGLKLRLYVQNGTIGIAAIADAIEWDAAATAK